MSILSDQDIEKRKKEIINAGFNYREFDLSKVDISQLHSSIQEDYDKETNNGKNYILNNELYRKIIKFEVIQGTFVFSEVDFQGVR